MTKVATEPSDPFSVAVCDRCFGLQPVLIDPSVASVEVIRDALEAHDWTVTVSGPFDVCPGCRARCAN